MYLRLYKEKMDLSLDCTIGEQYKSKTQKARVITEHWLEQNMFCPKCGQPYLKHFTANRPVADFYCDNCRAEYELKSREKENPTPQKIISDGCYETMIKRIMSLNNPNLFIMTHFNHQVSNLILIPNFFFVPEIIIKRPPLKPNARRAGWVGCNINIGIIPSEARIPIITNSQATPVKKVVANYNRILALQTGNIQQRGWLMDVMACLNQIPTEKFSLKDVYAFEDALKIKHSQNHHIKDKLRQILQILRDKEFIEFTSPGNYRKIKI